MILCPIDFSSATPALLRVAADLARGESDATLTLLHVARSAAEQTAAATQLDALRQLPDLAHLTVRTLSLTGCAPKVIAEQAATLAASSVVLSAHGAGGPTRFLMGSTAEAVLRTAPCPTLLLTLPSAAENRSVA